MICQVPKFVYGVKLPVVRVHAISPGELIFIFSPVIIEPGGKMNKRTLIFFLLLIAMAAYAEAGEFELSLNNGAIRNCFTVGIAPSLKLSRHFSLEMEFSLYPNFREEFQSDFEYNIPGNGNSGRERIKNSAYNISLAALYELKIKSLKTFVPYITAGIGFLHRGKSSEYLSYSGDENHMYKSSKNDLHVALGGGFKYRLTDKAGLRFDCRWISVFGIYGDDGTTAPEFDSFGVRFTGGFYIKLSK